MHINDKVDLIKQLGFFCYCCTGTCSWHQLNIELKHIAVLSRDIPEPNFKSHSQLKKATSFTKKVFTKNPN